ncbi:MAG TPA: alpha-2-macroglobulin family protein, partial [Niastella sp.]
TDARTEDSLYFRNSAFIDSILLAPGTPADLLLIMHVIQAHRLANFNNKPSFNRARYEKKDLPFNYAAFTDQMLDSAILYHYEQAINLVPASKMEDLENYIWLSSNPLVFLFKPTLHDIIKAEQIAYNSSVCRFDNSWKKQFSHWLKLSPADFIKALDTVQNKSREVVVLRLFNDWLRWHQKDSAAFFFIESLARKYIYEKIRYDNLSEPVYEKYLQAGAENPIREVRAHAVYQLCLLWNSRSRMNDHNTEKFPPSKALQLYESNRSLFDDFAFLDQILEAMKKQILQQEIYWKMDGCVLPDEPFLSRIDYKNASNLYYRVIPMSYDEQLPKKKDTSIMYLLNKPFLRSIHEILPGTDDLDKHRTFLKIDPLPAGHYRILFASKEIAGYDDNISILTIQVTQIAIAASDNRVYVLNRKTGLPLEGAQVLVSNDDGGRSTDQPVNRHGYVLLHKKEKHEVIVINGRDTLRQHANASDDELPDQVYDKESGDLLEFYIDHARIHMLTDRSIYRPGQTVYYKGILTTKDPYTGANIIVNNKNLRHGLFRNFLKKWLYEEEPEIYIADPFNRKVDTIPVKPNSYGSITGSFRLPATAATGRWDFDGDIEAITWRDGSFRVEEYKRPTFELTAEPPATSYLPGDAVTFKLKVRSFAGSTMANSKIIYNVKRTSPYYMPDGMPREMTIDSVVLTGANGIAEIVISDTALRNALLPDSIKWDFRYTLKATATDLSGESHDISSSLQVSSRPVVIDLPVKGNYYINDLKPVLVTAKDLNKVELSKEIKVKVFRERKQGVNMLPAYTNYADQWKYPETQLAQWFPHMVFSDKKQERELVYEITINTGAGEKIRIPAGVLIAGKYTVQAVCYDNNILRGKEERSFTIYDTVSGYVPGSQPSFFHLPVNNVNPGDSVQVYTGSAFDSTYLLLQIKYYSLHRKKLMIVPVFREQLIKAGVHSFKFHVPKDVTDHAIITSFFIKNNEVCQHTERVWISGQSTQPAIIIEQFRNKLTPGQQTTFTVSVKTKDHNVAAELMSTLYDASLDKLKEHSWGVPRLNMLDGLHNGWPRELNNEVSGTTFFNRQKIPSPAIKRPLWWMRHTVQHTTNDLWKPEEEDWDRVFTKVEGRVAGLSITQTTGFDNVVVIGYGSTKRRLTAANSVITIRGSNSLNGDFNQLLVILDGAPYTGKLNELNEAEITDMMVLKDANATAIYGSRAANGVIVISTKGPIKLPEIKQEPVVRIRSNFNELAFFYPAVYADKDGYYRFTFTVPESLTEWNWKLFAHTKKAQFAYAERKLTTQLPFMIIPNLPKLLYQGDQLMLKSRISNLDSLHRTGKTICKVEDAVTGEDITAAVVQHEESQFDVAGNSNTVTGCMLRIPTGQLNPVKIIIKAMAGDFADGEEHIIPILTDKILVKQAVPFSLSNHTDTLITLTTGKELYGVGLSIQPKPQAALINSLPFLANYSFDCAEQTFNKMLANIIAFEIMRTDKLARQVYTTAKQTTEKRETPALLPDQLSEQAMPWLQLSSQTALQQKKLFQLFDTVRTRKVIEGYLNKLYSLQNNDGGLSWFEGGKSNPYISAYVLAGFGKLTEQSGNLVFLKEERTRNFMGKLIQYVDGNLEVNDLFK